MNVLELNLVGINAVQKLYLMNKCWQEKQVF